MPLSSIRADIAAAISVALEEEFDHRPKEVAIEVSPRRDLGDLAWPGALPLAGILKRPPRQIAEVICARASWPVEVDRVAIAGPGFVNFFLVRGAMLNRLLRGDAAGKATAGKTIVEHTNINPNKAAHIGHLRNAVLGDVLVRCLRHLHHVVEVQNYIDDTGVQVADVVVGLLYLPENELAAAAGLETCRRDELIEQIFAKASVDIVPEASTNDFDDLCWEVYPKVTATYEANPEFAAHRAGVLHMVEEGHGGLPFDHALQMIRAAVLAGDEYPQRAVAALSAAVAEANLRCHLATMARLGITYDVLPHESDILHLGFWQRAFHLLKEAGAIRRETEGKNEGCWVMSLAASAEFADMDDPDKILVRSNGTVTYTAKDIAYQLWKLGLLRDPDGSLHDFGYGRFASWTRNGPAEPVRYGAPGANVMRTTSDPTDTAEGLTFGAGQRVYNVIDVRQSYPQKVVKEAVRVLGHDDAADASIHYAYEMVALSPGAVRLIEERTGKTFGLTPDDMNRAFIEMSGRRGIGVRADEFLDILRAAAAEAVADRAASSDDIDDLEDRSRAIAVGALRYLMARQSRNRILAFDFDDALAFEGDTGPYLQYSAVRARKIFEKLAARRGEGRLADAEIDRIGSQEIGDDLWELVFQCARRREVVAQAVAALEFSLLAQHVQQLAQLFHRLYHVHPVIPEQDDTVRLVRRAVFSLFVNEMEVLLEQLLGIPIPEAM